MAESRHDSIRRRRKENGFLDLKAEVLVLGPYSPKPLTELSLVSFPPHLRFFLSFSFFSLSLSSVLFYLKTSPSQVVGDMWHGEIPVIPPSWQWWHSEVSLTHMAAQEPLVQSHLLPLRGEICSLFCHWVFLESEGVGEHIT